MIPAALASTGSIAAASEPEIIDSTTMTHGTDGGKFPTTGYYISSFGSLANLSFRDATIRAVATAFGVLKVELSGNRAPDYLENVTCVLGTFHQSTASHAYNSTLDSTSWSWAAAAFSASGTSTVDLAY